MRWFRRCQCHGGLFVFEYDAPNRKNENTSSFRLTFLAIVLENHPACDDLDTNTIIAQVAHQHTAAAFETQGPELCLEIDALIALELDFAGFEANGTWPFTQEPKHRSRQHLDATCSSDSQRRCRSVACPHRITQTKSLPDGSARPRVCTHLVPFDAPLAFEQLSNGRTGAALASEERTTQKEKENCNPRTIHMHSGGWFVEQTLHQHIESSQ